MMKISAFSEYSLCVLFSLVETAPHGTAKNQASSALGDLRKALLHIGDAGNVWPLQKVCHPRFVYLVT